MAAAFGNRSNFFLNIHMIKKGGIMVLTVKTRSRTELVDVTGQVRQALASQDMTDGFCMLFVPHTTAGVTINESADPAVKADILKILNQVIPFEAGYAHMEGNSAAHIKSSLVGCSQIIAVENKQLVLGTWQGIFFCEFDGPRTRKLHVRFSS